MSNSPEDWLIIVQLENGDKACINLWEAIEQGLLTLRVNPLNRAKVIDACADCEENRQPFESLDKQ